MFACKGWAGNEFGGTFKEENEYTCKSTHFLPLTVRTMSLKTM